MKISKLAILLTAFISVSANADSYMGVGYLHNNVEIGSANASPASVMFKYGTFWSDSFSVEGRLAIAILDDSISGLDVEVEQLFGVYGVYNFAAGRNINPYLMLGYTDGDLNVASLESSRSGASYGAGADFKLDDWSVINIDYTRYLNEDGIQISGINLGYTVNF